MEGVEVMLVVGEVAVYPPHVEQVVGADVVVVGVVCETNAFDQFLNSYGNTVMSLNTCELKVHASLLCL